MRVAALTLLAANHADTALFIAREERVGGEPVASVIYWLVLAMGFLVLCGVSMSRQTFAPRPAAA